MRLIPLALAIGLVGLLATPAIAEEENVQFYGNCQVGTVRNDFTDKVDYHALLCEGKNDNILSENPQFAIACGARTAVLLGTGELQVVLGDNIDVVYRWGKEKAQKGVWRWADPRAIATGIEIANRFLEGMSSTNRLVFQVGNEKAIILISENGRLAIPDLKARCGMK